MNLDGWEAFAAETGLVPLLLSQEQVRQEYKKASGGWYNLDWVEWEGAAWDLLGVAMCKVGGDPKSLPRPARGILALLQSHAEDLDPKWKPKGPKHPDEKSGPGTARVSPELRDVFHRVCAADCPPGLSFDAISARSESMSFRAFARFVANLGLFHAKGVTLSVLQVLFRKVRAEVEAEDRRTKRLAAETGRDAPPEAHSGLESCGRGRVPYQVFVGLVKEVVSMAVSRLGEEGLPYGIKCIEGFIQGKTPKAPKVEPRFNPSG